MSTPFQGEPQTPSRNPAREGSGPPWLRTLRAVFVVIFFSIVLYAVIGTFLSRTHPDIDYDLQQVYKIISYLGGLCVAGLLLIRNLINRAQAAQAASEADTGLAFRSSRRVRALILIAFVISEMIALLGLAFVLVGGSARVLYIFCAISLACLILFFPRDPE